MRVTTNHQRLCTLCYELEANRDQVITKCSAPGQIALAYDDGPYQYTQKLVDTLTAGGAKGTFFVTGKH
jgi:peptidoglycan/xylan/chitin deacetylase (PgdA/CDA1 family)